MSKIETNTIDNISGSSTLTIGDSNTSTITLKSGATLTNFPANTPAWCVTKSSNQTVSDNTYTQVTFDEEILDSDGAFASNQFTVPSGKAGKYFIYGTARPNTSTDFSYFILYIYQNSDRKFSVWERNLDYDNLSIHGVLDLAVGDTVSLYVRHNLGSNLDVGAQDNGKTTVFGGYKLIT